jgi:hypothetical protein
MLAHLEALADCGDLPCAGSWSSVSPMSADRDPFASVPNRDRFIAELADREAIRDCLYRYCRGIDRCDAGLLQSAFWPDALDSHAMPGKPAINAYDFIARVIPRSPTI